jgi:hypothetical protein
MFTFIALCLALIGEASAEGTNKLQATIPFDFAVGNNVMPSGTYWIKPASSCEDHAVLLQNCRQVDFVTVSMGEPLYEQAAERGKLIFHKYGNQYFLREIHGGPYGRGWTMQESRREKNTRLERATVRTYETIKLPAK